MRSAWIDGERERAVDLVPLGPGRYRVTVDDAVFEVTVEPLGPDRFRLVGEGGAIVAEITAVGARRFVRLGHADFAIERAAATRAARGRKAHEGRLESPMPGVVTKVLVAVGDSVAKGQPLLAVEAMKMEHLIRAPREGRVVELKVRAGEMVASGVPLVELDGDEA
jgi:3-methylcrotonyl-CoA carboxylase alpha subunit